MVKEGRERKRRGKGGWEGKGRRGAGRERKGRGGEVYSDGQLEQGRRLDKTGSDFPFFTPPPVGPGDGVL